jgi:hypothetical protein
MQGRARCRRRAPPSTAVAASRVDGLTADAPNSRHPPVTARAAPRLARPGGHRSLAGTVRARLPLCQCERRWLRSPKTQGQAGIEPAGPWPPPGVNRPVGRFNITPCSANLRQSLAGSLGGASAAPDGSRPGGFAEQGVMSGAAGRRHAQPHCRCAQRPVSALVPAAPAQRLQSGGCRRIHNAHGPRPPGAVCCARVAPLRVAPCRARSRPARPPPPAGAPHCRSEARKGNRERPCGASRTAGLHRRRERVLARAASRDRLRLARWRAPLTRCGRPAAYVRSAAAKRKTASPLAARSARLSRAGAHARERSRFARTARPRPSGNPRPCWLLSLCVYDRTSSPLQSEMQ